jgi:hypothetical protein
MPRHLIEEDLQIKLQDYATKEDLSNVSVDMSDYYTKQETRDIATKYANQAVSTSDDFQDLLGDVRTMQETVAYQADVYTKQETDSELRLLEQNISVWATGQFVPSGSTYTIEEIDNKLKNYVDTPTFNLEMDAKRTKQK